MILLHRKRGQALTQYIDVFCTSAAKFLVIRNASNPSRLPFQNVDLPDILKLQNHGMELGST